MKRENFISLILGTIGGLLFALGMCMALLPEWNTFHEGIAMGVAGLFVLLFMVIVRRKMLGKPPIRLSGKAVGGIVLGMSAHLPLALECACAWYGA